MEILPSGSINGAISATLIPHRVHVHSTYTSPLLPKTQTRTVEASCTSKSDSNDTNPETEVVFLLYRSHFRPSRVTYSSVPSSSRFATFASSVARSSSFTSSNRHEFNTVWSKSNTKKIFPCFSVAFLSSRFASRNSLSDTVSPSCKYLTAVVFPFLFFVVVVVVVVVGDIRIRFIRFIRRRRRLRASSAVHANPKHKRGVFARLRFCRRRRLVLVAAAGVVLSVASPTVCHHQNTPSPSSSSSLVLHPSKTKPTPFPFEDFDDDDDFPSIFALSSPPPSSLAVVVFFGGGERRRHHFLEHRRRQLSRQKRVLAAAAARHHYISSTDRRHTKALYVLMYICVRKRERETKKAVVQTVSKISKNTDLK